MRPLPPIRPGTTLAASPLIRWLVILLLGFSVLGLLFIIGALVWTGWFAPPDAITDGLLPRTLIPLLAIPVVAAVIGYALAIWRAWRRKPAIDAWLVGVGAHLAFLVIGAMVSGGASVAGALTWDNFWTLVRLGAPGLLLLTIERDRLENPRRP